MPGLKADQIALYMQDMYAAERESYAEMPTVHDQVFKVVYVDKGAGDKITQVLGAGNLTRHVVEGQDVNYKTPVQGWEFLIKYWTYSDGIALTKEAVEDSVKLGNLLKELAATWGTSERVEKETLGSTVFNHGGDLAGEWVFNGTHTGNSDSSGDLLYDSYPLFNVTGNSRSTKGGGTYYNSIASLTLTPGNFETIYDLATATNNKDERDRIIRNPVDTLLTEPGSEHFKAIKIVDTPNLPSTQLNDISPYYKIVSPLAWDYLDDSQAFYVGKRQSKDFQFRIRQKSEIRFFRDENNLGYKASINLRMGILIKNWRTWHRGGGSAA